MIENQSCPRNGKYRFSTGFSVANGSKSILTNNGQKSIIIDVHKKKKMNISFYK